MLKHPYEVGSFYIKNDADNNTEASNNLDPSYNKTANKISAYLLSRKVNIQLHESGEVLQYSKKETKKIRPIIDQEIRNILSATTESIDPNGPEAARIRSLALQILQAFLHDSSSDQANPDNFKDTDIKSVQEKTFFNYVSLAIHLAAHPHDCENLIIQVGYGGSADDEINMRAPSYVVPALNCLSNLKKVIDILPADLNIQLPRIRILFAPHAAIAVNGAEMDKDKVLKNADKLKKYISAFILEYYPEIESLVYFEVEQPWDQHDQTTKLVIDYFSDILLNSSDETVKSALETLERVGSKHGKEVGSKLSHMYGAIHTLLFKDNAIHPQTNIFTDPTKPKFAISLGGKPERLFNSFRIEIGERISTESLNAFAESINDERILLLIQQYIDLLSDQSATVYPLIQIMTQIKVGSDPVYYQITKYQDMDISIDNCKSPSEHIEKMKKMVENIESPQEQRVFLSTLKGLEHDFNIMVSATGGENNLIDFVTKFSKNGYQD